MSHTAKAKIAEITALADIKINGDRPWDLKVHNEDFYERAFTQGSIGLGESYMDNWWDVKALDQFFCQLFSIPNLQSRVKVDFKTFALVLRSKVLNMQSKSRSHKVAKEHYDLGNDFYEKMLDKRMLYTCAYWDKASSLDEAQEHKLELICKKLMLKPGEKVLDLGCGWGSFAKYAAEKYKCHVKAYNISTEQVKYARESCKGLPVEIIQKDYREAEGMYDKVAAIGLTEHVGHKNYRTLMETVHSCLKDHGAFLLHTIGSDISLTATYDPWFDKYIFPNAMIPSIQQLSRASEGLFVMEDWHNLNVNYDKTLMAWYENFDKHWPEVKAQFDERFYRMWRYYLLSSAGGFRARTTQLWQIVFSKRGIMGGYQSVR